MARRTYLQWMASMLFKAKIPLVDQLKTEFAKVEERAGIKVRDYLKFGKVARGSLKFREKKRGVRYIKVFERSANNESPNGRCIKIYSHGHIIIGCGKDSKLAPGNWIHIWDDRSFEVGVIYLKDGNRRKRATGYRTDGTEGCYDI